MSHMLQSIQQFDVECEVTTVYRLVLAVFCGHYFLASSFPRVAV